MLHRRNEYAAIGLGLVLWAARALALRFGLVGYMDSGWLSSLAVFLVAWLAAYIVVRLALGILRVDRKQALHAGVCLVAPGMLLDIVVVFLVHEWLPFLSESGAAALAGLLLWFSAWQMVAAYFLSTRPRASITGS
jgi:hypothetical protein